MCEHSLVLLERTHYIYKNIVFYQSNLISHRTLKRIYCRIFRINSRVDHMQRGCAFLAKNITQNLLSVINKILHLFYILAHVDIDCYIAPIRIDLIRSLIISKFLSNNDSYSTPYKSLVYLSIKNMLEYFLSFQCFQSFRFQI